MSRVIAMFFLVSGHVRGPLSRRDCQTTPPKTILTRLANKNVAPPMTLFSQGEQNLDRRARNCIGSKDLGFERERRKSFWEKHFFFWKREKKNVFTLIAKNIYLIVKRFFFLRNYFKNFNNFNKTPVISRGQPSWMSSFWCQWSVVYTHYALLQYCLSGLVMLFGILESKWILFSHRQIGDVGHWWSVNGELAWVLNQLIYLTLSSRHGTLQRLSIISVLGGDRQKNSWCAIRASGTELCSRCVGLALEYFYSSTRHWSLTFIVHSFQLCYNGNIPLHSQSWYE